MQDQSANETPQQAVERELRAAQAQVREVAETLRAALAENERHAEQANDGRQAEQTKDGRQAEQANGGRQAGQTTNEWRAQQMEGGR